MVIGIIAAILGSNALFEFIKYLINRRDNSKGFATKDDLKGVRRGLMAISQNLLEEKMQYFLSVGEITDTQFKALTTLTEAYVDLGGNSFVHTLYDQCRDVYDSNKTA